MQIELSTEQIQQLEMGQAVDVRLPTNSASYIILRKETYDQIQEMLDDWDPRVMKKHLARMMADDWNDPAMNVYDGKEYDRE